ncbi:MAG TPA: right-handed parallel beta-helix repeat-containing protein [Solirubrobacteraceae bacterium]|nr:right-handed parallel beta-helix repeat-containing protein [Solirubrobacteraceae bacterium]
MTSRRRTSIALAAAAATALALPAAAPAANYPPPANPGASQGKPRGPFRTVTVCAPKARKAKRCVRSIQKAVNRARPGDTVRLTNGTYRQSVKIFGARKRYLRLVGNPKDPSKVVLDGARLRGAAKQNGVFIKDADQVTVKGVTATHFNGNGFFVLNATGYTLTRLRAMQTGVYGVYAFNSRGGTMSDSVAAWNNDSGFYIGQTPPQSRPVRSFVRNVSAYGNVLGFSGTNMRYVTITRSRWFNNGLGIVPNALDSEKFAPPEDNEIVDNDIFWNNFDYYKGAPFKLRKEATGTPYPVGTGVLLFGGRRTRVEGNRVYGNFLVGVGGVQQVLLKQQDAQQLVGNVVRNNVFGAGGGDLNGRDLYYDGDGTDNCWGPNTTLSPNEPADDSTFAACPFTGANAFRQDTQAMALAWAIDPQESHWIRHGHAPKPGYTPLETYVPGQTPMEQPSK